MGFQIQNNEISYLRNGETVRLSACGKNSIRFQASPNGRIENQDWTLMPRKAMASAWLENDFAVLENGSMRAELYKDGRAVYYCRDKKILAEKPELAFGQGSEITAARQADSGVRVLRLSQMKRSISMDLDMSPPGALI